MEHPTDSTHPHNEQPDGHCRIEAACRFLEVNLDDDPPLDEVANAANYSRFHFHRLFRGFTGETVRGYSRRLRLERSAHRLVHTDDDLLNVALDAGYSSHEAYTRAFTTLFSLSPSAYRKAKVELKSATLTSNIQMIDVRIETREPCAIACTRHVGPYSDVGLAWKTLMKWGWAKMVFSKAQTFGLCYDDPDVTDPERVRYDACMIVREGTRTKRGVQLQQFAGGHYAVTLHEGAYATLGETYASLFAHIVTHPIDGRNWKMGDPPSLELYLNDPRKTAPEELRTEIMMPVYL